MSGADIGAAVFMGLTWLGVIALTAFCFSRILKDHNNHKKRKK